MIDNSVNMRHDTQVKVSDLISEVEKRKKIRDIGERYRIIASLMAGKETDITGDRDVFTHFNSERLTLDELMSLYPEDCNSAMLEAKQERELNEKGWNPKSGSRMRKIGIPPVCVVNLFNKIYVGEEGKKAWHRFFKNYPSYSIPFQKHFHNVKS